MVFNTTLEETKFMTMTAMVLVLVDSWITGNLLPLDVENRTIYQGPPLSKVSHFVPNG